MELAKIYYSYIVRLWRISYAAMQYFEEYPNCDYDCGISYEPNTVWSIVYGNYKGRAFFPEGIYSTLLNDDQRTVFILSWVILKSLREMISLFLLIFQYGIVKGQITLNDLNTKLANLETKVSNLEREVKVRIISTVLFDNLNIDE